MRKILMLSVLALLAFGTSQAFAGSITYTEQAVASGTLGTSPFTNALVTITLVGDTANVTGGSGFFMNTVGTFNLDVAGVGTATFTDAMEVFVNQGFPAAGIGDLTQGGSVLDTIDAAFTTYALTTAIGPITDTAFIRPDLTFNTTAGGFNIQSSGNATFTATTATTTPEPASLILLGTGALGMLGFIRRKLML